MSWTHRCPKCGMSWKTDSSADGICPFCHYDFATGKMPGENGYNGNWNYDQPNNNNQPSYGSGGGINWSELSWNKVLAILIGFGGSGAWIWFINRDGVIDWLSALPGFFDILVMLGPIALCIFYAIKLGLKD